ncbi:spore germination protein, amino acid permease [Desulfosporosinus orientis DSM 765]|uniref:Spore germination protein, amino acid permease n=1 Tax=Desulfosporosinus orientis (strain ATCC 19365 / DSM 765 / NCIMB 8382 / VKM B-1628 / Singapore I) TaxID=768706 RepID=G7W7B7_DESOD|nr:endospore germination permease [Desulfosporosinus orientis]AET65788.1 spore germination protein, amino acid permease [Desulfosporosinus orientis DSM 765]
MERISSHQFMILGASVLLGTTFLPIASMVSEVSSRDGWMSVLPGFALGIPYGLMIISLLQQYPGKNLLQISELLLGKWIGKAIGILYILITGYFGGLLLSQAGDIYGSSIMPITPIGMFYLGTALLVFYLINSGIEVFARFTEIIFPFVVIALILNIALSIPRIEQGELLPILSEGIKPLLAGGLKVAPFPMEYCLFLAGLLTFLPTDKQEFNKLKSGVWRAVFVVGFLNMLVVIIQITVFGPEETVGLVYGILVLGKMVEVSRTLAGIESLFLGAWLGALVIKSGAFFLTTIWGLKTVFNLKGSKWNIGVIVVFMGIASSFRRGPSLIAEIGMVDDYLILPFTSIWLLALWGMSHWKKGANQ